MSNYTIPSEYKDPAAELAFNRPAVKPLSRTPEVDMNKILDNFPGDRYKLILTAARYLRKHTMDRRKQELDPYVTPIDALLYAQEGKLDPEKFTGKKY